MDSKAHPIHEFGAREVPRRGQKKLIRIAAGLLLASGFSLLHQNAAPEEIKAKAKEPTEFQFHPKHPAADKKLETRKIVLQLISKTMHAPEFKNWMSAVQPQAQPATTSNSGNVTHNVTEFLSCTRGHESDTSGGYRAVSAGGTYRGAYQFDQSTWNNTAVHAGKPNLVGVDPAQAPPADQDALAANLYLWKGNAPWNGRC